jgi:multiple sugar transport system substrate-binding protein
LHENGFQFERFIKEAIESVMLSNMPSEEALDILRERIQEVLDDQY